MLLVSRVPDNPTLIKGATPVYTFNIHVYLFMITEVYIEITLGHALCDACKIAQLAQNKKINFAGTCDMSLAK